MVSIAKFAMVVKYGINNYSAAIAYQIKTGMVKSVLPALVVNFGMEIHALVHQLYQFGMDKIVIMMTLVHNAHQLIIYQIKFGIQIFNNVFAPQDIFQMVLIVLKITVCEKPRRRTSFF